MKTIKSISVMVLGTLFFITKTGLSQDLISEKNNQKSYQTSLILGTNGLGLNQEIPQEVAPKITVKAGVFFYKIDQEIKLNLQDDGRIFLAPNFLSYGLNLAVEKQLKSWLKLEINSAIFLKQKWNLNINTDRPITFSGLNMEPEDFGNIAVDLKWAAVQPGLGLSIGKIKPSKKWNILGVAGVRYMGSPKLAAQFEGFLETTTLDRSIPQVEHNIRNYSFYPILALEIIRNINFK
jgi:hypothetical protein